MICYRNRFLGIFIMQYQAQGDPEMGARGGKRSGKFPFVRGSEGIGLRNCAKR